MHYYLYQVTNNLNGKIYVGVHKTEDTGDDYMGSGKVICSAIKKYGIDNFTKVILETFPTSEEMFKREKEVVTEEFLLRPDTYNIRRGGNGGFDFINKNGLHHKGFKTAAERNRVMTPWVPGHDKGFGGKQHTNETKQKLSFIMQENNPLGFKGKHHTTESKSKISNATKGKIPWNKGKPQTAGTKEKIRKSVLRYLASQPVRALDPV